MRRSKKAVRPCMQDIQQVEAALTKVIEDLFIAYVTNYKFEERLKLFFRVTLGEEIK